MKDLQQTRHSHGMAFVLAGVTVLVGAVALYFVYNPIDSFTTQSCDGAGTVHFSVMKGEMNDYYNLKNAPREISPADCAGYTKNQLNFF